MLQLYSISAAQPSDWTAEIDIVGLISTALVRKQRFWYINGYVSLSIFFVCIISKMTKFHELSFAPSALKLWFTRAQGTKSLPMTLRALLATCGDASNRYAV